ncbi:DUF6528 family protein [bacterium]|nr:DUF6528 family protein [bacterium]
MFGKSWISVLALALAATAAPGVRAQNAAPEIVLCGWDEVFVLRLGAGAPEKIWSWRADEASGLPDSIRARFATTSDCKPVEGGREFVVTSSAEGVALVERATGKALFYATVANAHSADILPGGLLAVAASMDESGRGDRLLVFDLSTPGRILAEDSLPWGHGVVWDSTRQKLYALAGKDIRIYKLIFSGNRFDHLSRQALISLPEGIGHEMQPVPGTPFLAVSTSNHCWLFDRDDWSLEPHPLLADSADVKSISVNPVNGRISWTRADSPDWWTSVVRLQNPPGQIELPGQHLYKARWVSPQE